MSDQIVDRPFWRVTFDKDGSLTSDSGLVAELPGSGVTDLYVLAHGWGTETSSAERLSQAMFPLIAQAAAGTPAGAAPGFVGVFWPSLWFPEEAPPRSVAPIAAGLVDPVRAAAGTPSGAQIAASLKPAFPEPEQQHSLDRLGELVDTQPADPDQLLEFHRLLRTLVTSTDGMTAEDAGERVVVQGKTAAVFGGLAAMSKAGNTDAESLLDPFKTLWHGGLESWRVASYFEMKGRAGRIGQRGLGPLISRLADALPDLRVHLAGHSFGARLVSFSLPGLSAEHVDQTSPVKSLTLIQGAFSHYAFTVPLPWHGTGALAGMQRRVDGPLLATYSKYDRAVGWWYPSASFLAHSDSESFNDLTKRWGGMGADGYQVDQVVNGGLHDSGQPYNFIRQRFYSLNAERVIKAMESSFSGAHSDIRHPEVAWAVVAAANLNR